MIPQISEYFGSALPEIEFFLDMISGVEIKWKQGKRPKLPAKFSQAYPDAELRAVDPGNYLEWLL